MYAQYIIWIILLMVVSVISDIFIQYMAFLPTANRTFRSLKKFYNTYGTKLAPILAAATILTVFCIHSILFKIIFLKYVPSTYTELGWYLAIAIVLGVVADIIIDKFHIFGDALVEYYQQPYSYVWGFLAYLAALVGATIGNGILQLIWKYK